MRHQEIGDVSYDVCEIAGIVRDVLDEGAPLSLLLFVPCKSRRQGIRQAFGNPRLATREGGRDCTRQPVIIKTE